VAACLSVAGGVYALAIVWAGSEATVAAIERIGVSSIVTGAIVCSTTLLVRFLRWQLIFRHLECSVPLVYNMRVYFAGLALSSTPGKVGETLRSALLVPAKVPVTKSLAAFVADRLSDVIGVAALGAVSAALIGERQPILEAIAIVCFVGSVLAAAVLRSRPVPAREERSRFPRLLHGWRFARLPAASWAALWRGGRPLAYSALALVSYGLQAAVFAAFAALVAPQFGFLACLAIFASATLIGAASLIPGGLGAMDSALAIQLNSRGMPWADAIGVTIALRGCTLWLGWLVGCAALASFASKPPAGAAAE
jgi:glycosyltransferase 2 family protein